MDGDEIWPSMRIARKFVVHEDEVRVHLVLDRPVALVRPGILGLLVDQQQLDRLATSSGEASWEMPEAADAPLLPVAWARSAAEPGRLIALQLKVNTLQLTRSTSLWLRFSPKTLHAMAAKGTTRE